ncbi:recombination protein RecR [Candidatus Fermentibacteria bacterium]|nr:MAG: recombination protein RecR [Candidatus Fermentibacteria bacterium]
MNESILDSLADSLGKLPGIGRKTALRLAFALVDNRELASELSEVLAGTVRDIRECSLCRNLNGDDVCLTCRDKTRQNTICVVHTPADQRSMEDTGLYRGYYFVLHGTLAPLDGTGPSELGIPDLVKRAVSLQATEVILALDSTTEGEATCAYIANVLEAEGIRVTRLARGLPPGALVEFADSLTLSEALKGRRSF